jgi:hypothetical protein
MTSSGSTPKGAPGHFVSAPTASAVSRFRLVERVSTPRAARTAIAVRTTRTARVVVRAAPEI